jgi:L-fucose mutarotase/ribose pyranase (RbsD/FucU family)
MAVHRTMLGSQAVYTTRSIFVRSFTFYAHSDSKYCIYRESESMVYGMDIDRA